MSKWDARCASILVENASCCTNAGMAAEIERQTGLRFTPETVSRYRAAAGLPHPAPLGHGAALRRWRLMEDAAGLHAA